MLTPPTTAALPHHCYLPPLRLPPLLLPLPYYRCLPSPLLPSPTVVVSLYCCLSSTRQLLCITAATAQVAHAAVVVERGVNQRAPPGGGRLTARAAPRGGVAGGTTAAATAAPLASLFGAAATTLPAASAATAPLATTFAVPAGGRGTIFRLPWRRTCPSLSPPWNAQYRRRQERGGVAHDRSGHIQSGSTEGGGGDSQEGGGRVRAGGIFGHLRTAAARGWGGAQWRRMEQRRMRWNRSEADGHAQTRLQ